MSTIRQQIVAGLVTRLKTLTTANGYASNAGQNVYWLYPENLQVESLPMLVISDVSDTVEGSGRDQVQHALTIRVDGFASSGVTMAATLEDMIGDIVSVVMDPEDRTLGGVCDSIQVTDGGTIQLEQQTDKTVGSVTLNISAIYRTDRGDWSVKI